MNAITQELKDITKSPKFENLKVIDVDAHWSEPHDLWTSRCPASMKDKVPRVVEKDGDTFWVFGEEQTVITPASPTSVIAPDGTKIYGGDFYGTRKEQVHEASFELGMRLEFMDKMGIHAQIVYPNVGGLKPTLFNIADNAVREATVQIYNDASLEWQEKTNNRILPMAAVPFWGSIDAVIAECERTRLMGSRGITLSGDVHAAGVPDLGDEYWTPLWQYCEDKDVPINFHIGGSQVIFDMLANTPWPTLGGGLERGRLLQSCAVFQDNARTIGNLIMCGVPERHPKLKFVSVESGLGWLPFYLESLDYQAVEQAGSETDFMSMKPSEYFKQNFYASFWFESGMGKGLKSVVDTLGADRIMFETDFPHPTCLYPDAIGALELAMKDVDRKDVKAIVQDTAASVYKIDV